MNQIYETINTMFLTKYNRNITKKELSYVLHHIFKNTFIRTIILQKFHTFQNNNDTLLNFNILLS